jgi:hypothetical protein
VLVNTEDMHRLADELRAKINSKIKSWAGVAEPTEAQEREVSPDTNVLSQALRCRTP